MNLPQERDKLRQAYELGYDEFDNIGVPAGEIDLSVFHSTARYANIILPKLREIAGFEDASGKGTYQQPPCGEVEHFYYDEVVETFHDGANDAIQGREPDVTRHIGSDP